MLKRTLVIIGLFAFLGGSVACGSTNAQVKQDDEAAAKAQPDDKAPADDKAPSPHGDQLQGC
ncbi:MAG: hypothetical protein CVU56_14125 [Deltaproteobacteria bacterium HGW-Deltaproteobacteria-14]|jgi:hypothetical protein|nr:MAG: hypothetical protein CVU56_14125 [Deltaproteobacteria bacterium HGW-Deltaproteobacteria-14]